MLILSAAVFRCICSPFSHSPVPLEAIPPAFSELQGLKTGTEFPQLQAAMHSPGNHHSAMLPNHIKSLKSATGAKPNSFLLHLWMTASKTACAQSQTDYLYFPWACLSLPCVLSMKKMNP